MTAPDQQERQDRQDLAEEYRDRCHEEDYRERETCWACHGEGTWHDCGEDTCCCLRPWLDKNMVCQECHGRGEL